MAIASYFVLRIIIIIAVFVVDRILILTILTILKSEGGKKIPRILSGIVMMMKTDIRNERVPANLDNSNFCLFV